ncbi:hypothetical protein CCR75_008568 [Bremia lactucae]|uniref:C2 domain-containing protein n=1 Tax=Bremia lactucae TaxID=4779 RepID=A0A976ICS6_BRELC|nr:hypothetical protein CCR75_008568 [Bremia lactucae]
MTLTRQQEKKLCVQIVLYKCQNLVDADMDIVDSLSNTFVNFSLSGVTKKSSCIKNSLNPQWSPPEVFEFELEEWKNNFLIANVFDKDLLKDNLVGSAVIPLSLYVENRHCEMYSYPLVLPGDLVGVGATKLDLFLQISMSTSDGNPVESFC